MAMTGVSELFVDTNILIYATNSFSPWHRLASDRLQDLRRLGIDLVISTQIVREYLAVASRSSITTGSPRISEMLDNVQVFRAQFRLVLNTEFVLDQLVTLIRSIPVAGRQVHDANIVATMQVYGVNHLLTHNTKDFERFAHLITVVPLEPTP